MAQTSQPRASQPRASNARALNAETLRVNPIACTGHGMCAELLPELISLDEWGYPIVDPQPVPPALDREARRAVAACPTLALKLIRADAPVRSA